MKRDTHIIYKTSREIIGKLKKISESEGIQLMEMLDKLIIDHKEKKQNDK